MAFINTLYNLWPNGDEKVSGLRDGIAATAADVFTRYGITSPLLVAHVMAQISHECGAGHDVVENLSYSAQRMTEVWPRRFPDIASAQPYAHNPKALANKTYNGRMGNRTGSDDGWNFRGRGGSQTTGREGYERVAKQTGFDVVNNPDILISPTYFLECSVSDFVNCGCLPYAKRDDLGAVSAALNVGDPSKVGSVVGMSNRREWLEKWKSSLGDGPIDFAVPGETKPKPPPKPQPVPVPSPAPAQPARGGFFSSIISIFKGKS